MSHLANMQFSAKESLINFGGHKAVELPDPIPNSDVKRCLADGSAGKARVRVGRRQINL